MFVYIAGSYTTGDPVLNLLDAIEAEQVVIEAGHIPFVPHLYRFWRHLIPGSHEQWMALDMAWLAKCDVLIRLPGHSLGADREVAEAQRLGLHVLIPETCDECDEDGCLEHMWCVMEGGAAFTGETPIEAAVMPLDVLRREAKG